MPPRSLGTHRGSASPKYELTSNASFGENRRIAKKVNGTITEAFLYQDALKVVAQLDGSGNLVARYVFGSRPNVPDYYTTSAGTFRILTDHLGSPRLIVNASTGAVAQEIDYDEFGNVTNDTQPGTTPFGFAGGLYDRDTGLVRFGARDYDASVGRWTSKDPIRFDGGQVNLYVYAGNDPINRFDPTGQDPLDCAVAGGLATAICAAAATDPVLIPACIAAIANAANACGPPEPPEPPVCQEPPPACSDPEMCDAVNDDCFIDPDTRACRSKQGRCPRSGGFCTKINGPCRCVKK